MKLRRLQVSPELLADFLVNPTPPGLSSDAPADLRILNCRWTDEKMIELLVSSDTFNNPADVLEPVPFWTIRFWRDQAA